MVIDGTLIVEGLIVLIVASVIGFAVKTQAGKFKSPKRWVIFLKAGRWIEMQQLSWRPGVVENTFEKLAWEMNPDCKFRNISINNKDYYAPLVDYNRGISVNMKKAENGYMIYADIKVDKEGKQGGTIGRQIDALMVTILSYLTPSWKDILPSAFMALLAGIFIKAVIH